MNFSIDECASEDINSIVDYYSGIRRSLAVKFVEELYGQILLVCVNPKMDQPPL